MSVRLVLIHGIGDPPAGGIKKKVEAGLAANRITLPRTITLSEFNWNQYVKHPMGPTASDSEQVRATIGLGLAQVSAATLSPDREKRGAHSLLESSYGLTLSLVAYITAVLPVLVLVVGSAKTALVMGIALALGILVGMVVFRASVAPLVLSVRACLLIALYPIAAVFGYLVASPRYILRDIADVWLPIGIVGSFLTIRGDTFAITVRPWLIGGLAAGWLVLQTIDTHRAALRVPLKLYADVIRYLGEPGYAENLRSELATYLRQLPRDERSVCVAHSLGSVLLIDTLRFGELERKYWPSAIVTLGSPLRSLLHGFFPDRYPEPNQLGQSLLGSRPELKWVNIYQPADYVGRALFKPAPVTEHMRDKALLLSVRANHVGYWEDRVVAQEIGSLTVGLNEEHGEETGEIVDRRTSPLVQVSMNAWNRRGLLALAVVAAPLIGLTYFVAVAPYLRSHTQLTHKATALLSVEERQALRLPLVPTSSFVTVYRVEGDSLLEKYCITPLFSAGICQIQLRGTSDQLAKATMTDTTRFTILTDGKGHWMPTDKRGRCLPLKNLPNIAADVLLALAISVFYFLFGAMHVLRGAALWLLLETPT